MSCLNCFTGQAVAILTDWQILQIAKRTVWRENFLLTSWVMSGNLKNCFVYSTIRKRRKGSHCWEHTHIRILLRLPLILIVMMKMVQLRDLRQVLGGAGQVCICSGFHVGLCLTGRWGMIPVVVLAQNINGKKVFESFLFQPSCAWGSHILA